MCILTRPELSYEKKSVEEEKTVKNNYSSSMQTQTFVFH